MKTTSLQRKIIKVLLVLAILVVALATSYNTFWLWHASGDQVHHLCLALKLDTFGMQHYNLRGLLARYIYVNNDKNFRLRFFTLSEDPDEKGDVLKALDFVGIHYYDQALYHKPPAYPYMLVLAHRLLAKKGQPYVVVATNIAQYLDQVKPYPFFEAQYWAVVVPLFLQCLFILFTFWLGALLFSYRVGWYASAMVMLHPVTILAAHKLWSDNMVAVFVTLAIVLYTLADRRRSRLLAFAGGMSCGVAVLAKQTGGILIIAIALFAACTTEREGPWYKVIIRMLFNHYVILFGLGAFMVSGWWFLKVYRMYGNPLWLPIQYNLAELDLSGWHATLHSRPKGVILYPVGVPYLCPLFVFAYFTLKKFVFGFRAIIVRQTYDRRIVFLWVIILVYYFFLRHGSEHRRLLPVYAPWAVLAAYYLVFLRTLVMRKIAFFQKPLVIDLCILMLFVLCGIWTIPLGVHTAFFDAREIIQVPF